MQLNLSINLDNDAYTLYEDWAEHLRGNFADVALAVDVGERCGLIRDVNGNTVGQWTIEKDEEI
jgi:hypothetical protein